MTQSELLTRAGAYLAQALERLNAVEAAGAPPQGAIGEWVSLRRNIESAAADVETARRALPPSAPVTPTA